MKPEIKYFFILIIISSVFYSCSSGPGNVEKPDSRFEKRNIKVRNNDLAEREFIKKNTISSIEKIEFELDSQGHAKKGTKLSGQIYDQNGFLTETITYDENGNRDYRYIYDYDTSGVRQNTTRYDADGAMINKYTYEYDESGNKIKSVRTNITGDMEKYYEYENDDEGNLVEEVWYDASGKAEYRIENEYDEGRKIKSFTYDEDGKFLFEYHYIYDEQGNLLEEQKLNEEGKPVGMIQYVYKYY